jgi:hypothetical protein
VEGPRLTFGERPSPPCGPLRGRDSALHLPRRGEGRARGAECVWYAEHSDVEGLHVEGETFEAFCRNVASAVADLLEGGGAGEIHVEIIAHASVRADLELIREAAVKAAGLRA